MISKIYRKLSATCKRYTDVLAFKNQIQKQMFDGNTKLSDDVLLVLTSLIIKLQTIAMKLQDIEVSYTIVCVQHSHANHTKSF